VNNCSYEREFCNKGITNPHGVFSGIARHNIYILAPITYVVPRGRSSSPSQFKNFLFSKSSRPALGFTQPPIQWVLGDLSPGVKRPGREADHSPPTSAEVKKI
jgi:hypothetical protein